MCSRSATIQPTTWACSLEAIQPHIRNITRFRATTTHLQSDHF